MVRGDYSGLYARIESTFDIDDITPEAVEAYLVEGRVGPHKIKNGKTRDNKQRYAQSQGISSAGLSGINRLAEKIGTAGIIWQQAHEAEDSDTIHGLQKEAKDVVVHQAQLTQYLKERDIELTNIEREARITEEQLEARRQAELELAEREAFAQEFKQAETREERERAEEGLRETRKGAQTLGGIRSGERRRVPAAARSIFDLT